MSVKEVLNRAGRNDQIKGEKTLTVSKVGVFSEICSWEVLKKEGDGSLGELKKLHSNILKNASQLVV